MVLFDNATYDKLLKEVPQYKLITPSVVSERLKIRCSLARRALDELCKKAMIINVVVETTRLYLVPYLPQYVPQYHKWMFDPHLRELTGSEYLTLDQEMETQKKWNDCDDRATFILIHKKFYNDRLELQSPNGLMNKKEAQIDSMIGELSVMIAEPGVRGQGFASEAIASLLEYIGRNVSLRLVDIVAKISMTNESSLKLFEKIGFLQFEKNEVFKEITYKAGSKCENGSLALKVRQDICMRLAMDDWKYNEINLEEWIN